MKDRKFLFVNANDVERLTFKVEREPYCNDFENVLTVTGQENMVKTFKDNNVDDRYQKIILEINPKPFSRLMCKDYFTNKCFVICKDNPGIYVKGKCFEHKIDKYVVFKSNCVYHSVEDVVNFYVMLYKNNSVDNYINSLYSFYREDNNKLSCDKIKKLIKK